MGKDKEGAVRSIFKGGSIFFLGMLMSKLFGLGYRTVVGRFLGPTDYGIISVMMAAFSVSEMVSGLGIANGVQKFISDFIEEKKFEEARSVFQTGAVMVLVSSVVVSLVVFISAPWIANTVFNEPAALWPLRIITLVLPLRILHTLAINVTNAFEKMHYNVLSERLINNGLQLLIASILVYLGFNYMGAVFAYAFSFGIASFFSLYFANRVLPGIFRPSKSSELKFSKLFHFSWPLWAGAWFGIITGHIDTFMLQSFLGSEKVGLYQAAYPFAALLTVGAGLFNGIFLSNASKLAMNGKKEDVLSTYRMVVKWISIITVPVFTIIFVFPKSALVIFGKQYYGMVDVLRVLSVGFLLSAIIGPTGKIYQVYERTKLNLITSIIVAGGNLVLNLVLIPELGVMGAAIASTSAFVLAFLFNLFFVHRILGKMPFRLSVFKSWLAAGISILTVFSVNNLLFSFTPKWFFIADLAGFSILYGLLLLVFRTLEDEDILVLRAIRDKTGLDIEAGRKLVRKFS